MFFKFLAAGFCPKNNGFARATWKVEGVGCRLQTPWLVRPCSGLRRPAPQSVTACIKAPSPKCTEINYFSVNTSKSYQFDA